MTHKIILDTDPGIDDAMAILFAEAHPAIELLAITTVFGNATIENGTRNALWLKQKYGMKADVAQGAAAPLLTGSYTLAKDKNYTAIIWGRETALRLVKPLASIVHSKTKGLPLFVSEMLRALNRDGLLLVDLDGQRWVWDQDKIRVSAPSSLDQ